MGARQRFDIPSLFDTADEKLNARELRSLQCTGGQGNGTRYYDGVAAGRETQQCDRNRARDRWGFANDWWLVRAALRRNPLGHASTSGERRRDDYDPSVPNV